MNLLMAVMEKRLGISLSGCDAYLNVAGGLRVTEPALDLPVVLAILSGYRPGSKTDNTSDTAKPDNHVAILFPKLLKLLFNLSQLNSPFIEKKNSSGMLNLLHTTAILISIQF